MLLLLALVLGLLAVTGGVLFIPPPAPEFYPPRPAATYAEAVGRLQALQARDGAEVNPVCRTLALLRPERVQRAVVFYHGYTNCPEQFRPLGELLYQQGYSVIIPRFPHHGLRDRLTAETAKLSAEELSRLVGETVDIALGLGQEVTVAGISAGGVMAGWAAIHRPDLDKAFVIAPSISTQRFPDWLTVPITNVGLWFLPDGFMWWDDATRENIAGPAYAYPRYSLRGLGEINRMGLAVQGMASAKPKAKEIWVVTNAADEAVDNRTVYALTGAWKGGGGNVQTYEFPAEPRLLHDLIDPNQVGARTELVYPVLVRLLTQR